MSAIQVYFNNDLEQLAALCCRELQTRSNSTLQPEYILVHSQGMAHWLQYYIARQQGIAAHIKFLFPGHFLDFLRQQCVPDASEDLWSPARLPWRIYHQLLNSPAPALKQYLGEHQQSSRAWQLASSLSETFDKYRLYRPRQLEQWVHSAPEEMYGWQAALLQALSSEQDPLLVHKELELGIQRVDLQQLPARLQVFGMSSLAPGYLQTLAQLATRIPVKLYSLAPSPTYTGHLLSEKKLRRLEDAGLVAADEHYDVGNALIAQCGSSGCEFQILLDSAGAEFQDSQWREAEADTLLHRLQQDLLLVQESGRDDWPAYERHAEDYSIQLHNCHSPQRELEVLRDFILRSFKADPQLKADDIIIMAPDPDLYAPYIDAVFNYMDDGNEIPVSMADRHQVETRQLIDAFLACLQCLRGRLEKNIVLDLLYMNPVQERWGWNADSMSSVESVIDHSAVQWGRDADHRAALGLQPYAACSWHEALQRMLLSYFYGDDDGQMAPLQDLLPLDNAEGTGTGMLSQLITCIQDLISLHQRLPVTRSIDAWEQLLDRVINFIALDNEQHASGLQYLRSQIRSSTRAMREAAADLTINAESMLQHLREALTSHDGVQGFYDGRITFSGLKPMRSIPFKIICLIGMNDKAFPRQSSKLDFDLCSNSQRCYGDRDLNNEDRQLFLECLISCRDLLYISYCGQNAKDQQQQPPAHIIEEFIDYLARCCGQTRAALHSQLVFNHFLHPSHHAYTRSGSRVLTQSPLFYSGNLTAAEQTVFLNELPSLAVQKNISLNDLLRFWSDPVAALLRQRFAIHYYDPAESDEADSEFYWNRLQAWQLREALFAQENHIASERMQASRFLPYADHGQLLLDENRILIQSFVDIRRTLTAAPARIIQHGDWSISLDAGFINQAGEMHQLLPHTWNNKRKLSSWLRHLCLNLQQPQASRVSYLHKDAHQVELLEPIDHAADYMDILLDGYSSGMHRPLPFFLDSSFACAEAISKGNDAEQTRTIVEKQWLSESRQKHFALCWSDVQSLITDNEFESWAVDVWEPYLNHRSKG